MDPFGQMASPSAVAANEFGDSIDDPDLARAIEASYQAQVTEDDLLAEAMRISQLEEDERRRRTSDPLHVDNSLPVPMQVDEGGPPVVVPRTMPETASLPPNRRAPAPFFEDASMDPFLSNEMLRPGVGTGEALVPGAMDAEAMQAAAIAEQADMSDRELALAIEASYQAQTEGGRMINDDDLLQQALRLSQNEEETRQRQDLRDSQEQELQESILMDQMREQEEKKRRVEEQELAKLEAERIQDEQRKKAEMEQAKQRDVEDKRARIPAEPASGEAKVDIMIRFPDGKRVRRPFGAANTIGQVYDYIDIEGGEAVAAMVDRYRLVTTMPRQAYEDRSRTLAEAGLQGQCALLLEPITAS